MYLTLNCRPKSAGRFFACPGNTELPSVGLRLAPARVQQDLPEFAARVGDPFSASEGTAGRRQETLISNSERIRTRRRL